MHMRTIVIVAVLGAGCASPAAKRTGRTSRPAKDESSRAVHAQERPAVSAAPAVNVRADRAGDAPAAAAGPDAAPKRPVRPSTPAAAHAHYAGPAYEAFKASHPVREYYLTEKSRAIGEAASTLSLTDAQVAALVPGQYSGLKCACPRCGGKGEWQLDLARPDKLKCKTCGTYYPNERYPENAKDTYRSYFNKTVEVPYHRAPDGKKYYFAAALDELKWKHISSWPVVSCMGKAYGYTGDSRYAKRARDILVALARKADRFLCKEGESYLQMHPWPRHRSLDEPQALYAAHFSPGSRRAWNVNFICGYFENQQKPYVSMIELYDHTYTDECYDELIDTGDGERMTARRFIDERFFGRAAQYMEESVEAFGWEPHSNHSTGNIPGQYMRPVWIARVTGRMDHLRFFAEFLTKRPFDAYIITYDYHSLEGPGYHHVWGDTYLHSVREILRMEYPPAVKPIQDEILRAGGYHALGTATEVAVMPNGEWPSINDGWRGGAPSYRKLARSRSRMVPGFGHGHLGDGEGEKQIQVHLDFSMKQNHGHADNLRLLLFAHGRELFNDMGTYYGSGHYCWATSTLGHNTVVVDRKNQTERWGTGGGDIQVFEEMPGLAIMRADSSRVAYEKTVDRYRRTLVLNTVDMDHPYVLDIFEVKGGSTHDYSLRGGRDPKDPQIGSCSLGLLPRGGDGSMAEPGEKLKVGSSTWGGTTGLYAFVKNVERAKATRDGYVDFRYKSDPSRGTRTHFQKDDDLEINLGESHLVEQLWEKKGFHKFQDTDPVQPMTPHLIVRHRGGEGLRTLFVFVHEPVKGDSVIKRVSWRERDGGIAAAVTVGDRTDHYLVSLDKATKMSHEGLSTDGILGAAAVKDGTSDLWLVGGKEVAWKSKRLTQKEGRLFGDVRETESRLLGADEHCVVTDVPLPVGTELRGKWAILEFENTLTHLEWTSAFEIDRVEADGWKRRVYVKQDPALRRHDNALQEYFYPFRHAGYVRFTFTNAVSTVPDVVIAPNRGPYDPGSWLNDFVPFGSSESVEVQSVPAGASTYVTTDGSDPAPGRTRATSRLVVDDSCVVKAVAAHRDGVMQPRPRQVRFLKRLPAIEPPARTQTGIVCRLYSSGKHIGEGDRDHSAHKPIGTWAARSFDTASIKRGQAMSYSCYLDAPATGRYTFTTFAWPSARLYIDGVKVIDAFDRGAWSLWDGAVEIAKGTHAIRIEYENGHSLPGSCQLLWEGPGIPRQRVPIEKLSFDEGLAGGKLVGPAVPAEGYVRGLRGEYFTAKGHLRGALAFRKVDANVDFSWGGGAPEGLPENNFSVRWTGELKVPADGEYAFNIHVDDEAALYIDGRHVVSGRYNSDGNAKVDLEAGWVPIVLEYTEGNGHAGVTLSWSAPGKGIAPIPADAFRTRAIKGDRSSATAF